MTELAVHTIQDKIKRYQDPARSYEAESEWKANEAFHKEQNDYESMVVSFLGWMLQRRHTTSLIEPNISPGRPKKGDESVTLADYGFTRKQWERRRKELDIAVENIEEYIDTCIETSSQPTRFGLLRAFYQSQESEPDFVKEVGRIRKQIAKLMEMEMSDEERDLLQGADNILHQAQWVRRMENGRDNQGKDKSNRTGQ